MSDRMACATVPADILHGAKAISLFLFGSELEARKVYYMVEKGQLPCFRLGQSRICARRSTLTDFMTRQEGEAVQ